MNRKIPRATKLVQSTIPSAPRATRATIPVTASFTEFRPHAIPCSASPYARRQLSTTRTMSAKPNFSAGTDASIAQRDLETLLGPTGNWSLRSDGTALERALKFKTFKAAWTFMNSTAEECKKAKHHPEWSNVYNRVFIRWTTHNPAGLSEKDIALAKKCDEIALRDDSRAETDAGDVSDIRGVADTVVAGAGDCCTPSKGQKARLEEKEKIEKEEGDEGGKGSLAGVGGQPS